MAMRNFYNEIKGMKLKELPVYLKPMVTIDYIKNAINRGMDNYHAKYMQTSSIDPLDHAVFGLMFNSYIVAYPEMRRQQEEQERHGKQHRSH